MRGNSSNCKNIEELLQHPRELGNRNEGLNFPEGKINPLNVPEVSPSAWGQDYLVIWSSQTVCPPLQSPRFVPLGPELVSPLSLAEIWFLQ